MLLLLFLRGAGDLADEVVADGDDAGVGGGGPGAGAGGGATVADAARTAAGDGRGVGNGKRLLTRMVLVAAILAAGDCDVDLYMYALLLYKSVSHLIA